MFQSTMMNLPLSVNRILEHGFQQFPTSEIVSRLPDKSVVRHNFADLHRRAHALAAALRGAGLNKSDRVATLCWNHHVHLECYFGIPAAGGVMHTLNLRLAGEEIGWIAGHAEDRILIVDDILLPLFTQIARHHRFEKVVVFRFSGAPLPVSDDPDLVYIDYEDFLDASSAAPTYDAHDETDPVAMCYTSGTTGRPKGVVYSHRSTVLHSLTLALPDFFGLASSDVILAATPMFHANCWGVPYAAVMLGATLVMPGPHLHAEDLLDLMQMAPPTLALGVPTVWTALIDAHEANPGRWVLPPLRCVIGGSAVPQALTRRFADHGVTLDQGWGMTETSPLGAQFFKKPALAHLNEDGWFDVKALAGAPVPMIEVRIVSENGICDWNGVDIGELQVRGPFVTGSYYKEAQSEDKFTADGWLRTGDIAAIDPNGYLRIADRTKDLIKSGGEWISSIDLENAITAHPDVVEAAVIAIPHAKWGERPLACVVLKQGAALDLASLRDFLAPSFASWQLPDAVEFVPEIPRTSTGKFSKATLRKTYGERSW